MLKKHTDVLIEGPYVAEEICEPCLFFLRGNERSECSQLYVSCIDEVADMTAHGEGQEGRHVLKHNTRNDMRFKWTKISNHHAVVVLHFVSPIKSPKPCKEIKEMAEKINRKSPVGVQTAGGALRQDSMWKGE